MSVIPLHPPVEDEAPEIDMATLSAMNDEEVFAHFATYDDERALRVILRRYRSKVRGFFLKRLGDSWTADDLWQVVQMRLWRNRTDYDPTKPFSTWLFTIVNNLYRNEVRSRKRNRILYFSPMSDPAESEVSPLLQMRSDAPEPDAFAESEERRHFVRETMKLIPQDSRFLAMKDLHGHTYSQMADELQMPEGTIKSRVHQARLRFRVTYREVSGEDRPRIRRPRAA